ncbi:MAG: beta-lactamase family protein [Bacteroidetes bacterium]|nr:beta-lactamase family protein [Bacteroidota bacterium]
MKKICIASLLFLLNQSAFAQFDTTKLNQLLQNYETNNKAMMSIAITSKGKELYKQAIGYSDVEKSIKATTETTYHIGSITKMFTAVIMFQLIEEQKISLQTKLSKFYPKLPNSEKISIAHMLNHHSGLHNFVNDSAYLSYMSRPHTKKELLDLFANQESDFEPGSKGQYSNTNYVLLGYIIEELCGTSYNEQLQNRIGKKVGLQKTSISGRINSLNHEAISYEFHNNEWQLANQTDMSIPGGSERLFQPLPNYASL